MINPLCAVRVVHPSFLVLDSSLHCGLVGVVRSVCNPHGDNFAFTVKFHHLAAFAVDTPIARNPIGHVNTPQYMKIIKPLLILGLKFNYGII